MITGGCLCGAARYEAGGEPLFVLQCHCRVCQRVSGTGHVPVMGVAKALFKLTGVTTGYAVIADSGTTVTRHFCPICGSPVFATFENNPDAIGISVGSTDDPAAYAPQAILYTRSRWGWDCATPTLPEFEAMPPG